MRREQWVFLTLCGLLAVVLVAGLQMQPAPVTAVVPLSSAEVRLPSAGGPPVSSTFGAEDRHNPFRPPWGRSTGIGEVPPVSGLATEAPGRVPGQFPATPRLLPALAPWSPATLTLTRVAVMDTAGRPRAALLMTADGQVLRVEIGMTLVVPPATPAGATTRIQVIDIETDAVVLASGDQLFRIR